MSCDFSNYVVPLFGSCEGLNERAVEMRNHGYDYNQNCPYGMYNIDNKCVNCRHQADCGRLQYCENTYCVRARQIPLFQASCNDGQQCNQLQCIDQQCGECKNGTRIGDYICINSQFVYNKHTSMVAQQQFIDLLSYLLIEVLISFLLLIVGYVLYCCKNKKQ